MFLKVGQVRVVHYSFGVWHRDRTNTWDDYVEIQPQEKFVVAKVYKINQGDWAEIWMTTGEQYQVPVEELRCKTGIRAL